MLFNPNSNMSQETYSEYDGINDDVLIRSEIEKIDDLINAQEKTKRELIISAADKLAMKYQDDQTVICAKLQGILCRDKITKNADGEIISSVYARASKQYVREILPEKYKRTYKTRNDSASTGPENDDTPANEIEEALAWMAEIYENAASVAKSNLADLQELRNSDSSDDHLLYKEMSDTFREIISHANMVKTFKFMQKQIAEIRDMKEFVLFLKDLNTSVKSTKNLNDKRQKFSTAMKMHLQIMFVTESYDHVASKLTGKPHGAKWLSKIDRDGAIKKLNEILKCPNCGLNANKWIEKAKENQNACIDLPDFKDFCN